MKLNIQQKLGIFIIGIIIITFFVKHIINKYDELYEKREQKYKAEIAKQRQQDIEKWDSYFTESGDLQEGMLFDPTNFLGSLPTIFQAVMGISTTFLSIAKTFALFGLVTVSMSSLVTGIFNHVICGTKSFGSGFVNSAQITATLLKCSGEKITSLADGSCTRYYIVDLIFGLTYGVFIELPIILIFAITNIDLQFLVKLLYDITILPLDALIFALSGFHIVSWSDSVIKKCYRCKGTINGKNLEQTFGQWIEMYKCSFSQMVNGFIKVFTSLVPSRKWTAWLKKQNLQGWDDNPSFF